MSELVTLSVSQLNRYIASKLKSDDKLSGILIKGEISNFNNHFKTGHWYFTVKDETSALKGVMFKWANERMQFIPTDGMSVIIYGDIQVYEAGGVYQIYAKEIFPDGEGSLNLAFEQLKSKLEKLGLFDENHKRPIPRMPKKICVITAETGAALQDIINIISRRYPIVKIVLIPTLVQGKNAPEEIIKSINLANETDADTIILGRGGGSLEDLWAFNDEGVAYAVYNSKIPIISAVGHEIDFTICDFVADLRAPTPSAAAELAVPDKDEICYALDSTSDRLNGNLSRNLAAKNSLIENYSKLLSAKSPAFKVQNSKAKLNEFNTKISLLTQRKIAELKNKVDKNTELLSAFNPLSLLNKGYSLTYSGDKIIKSANEVNVGDSLTIKFSDSQITATVTERTKKNDI